MDLGLLGRVALVTGAAGGIGSAICRTLAGEGCDVALLDRVADARLHAAVESVHAAGRRALPLESDVTDFQAAERAVAEAIAALGRLDILVCAAGITRDAIAWKMDEAKWDDVIAVNLKGCFSCARAVAPRLRARAWGRIVMIASINGLRGKVGQANYAASKAGLIGLSKTLATELGRSGITVNAVAPGLVNTPMIRTLPAEALETALRETLVGHIADPADVADAVAFLCSERASHITGDVLRVDGGQYV